MEDLNFWVFVRLGPPFIFISFNFQPVKNECHPEGDIFKIIISARSSPVPGTHIGLK